MSETASVTASSLAIADNRPRRTGGCVGIFFQLFDWNRRFAKKKFFSKRLLPPDRAKEGSKKFGGDEKLPKLRLIADENSGGFPNMNKNGVSTANNAVGKHGGQTPSLVARLMGLESMPSVNKVHKAVANKDESSRQDTRPQKLQKTSMADRRTVTRFGAEALQLKNVLSRSRKHHHPKLASPVKTTTHHSRKNTSRLYNAATRILEPRSSKSRLTLTYPHSSRKDRIKPENPDSVQSSCKNCGNLLHITDSNNSVDPFENGNSRFNQEQEEFSPSTYFKNNNRRLNCLPLDTDAVSEPPKDFVALNRSLSGRTRSRVVVTGKVEDTKRGNCNYLPRGQKRQLPHIRKQGESNGYGVKGGLNNRPKMVMSGNGGSCSENKMRQELYQGQNGKSSEVFRFSSPMKNRCEVAPVKIEKKRFTKVTTSNQIDKLQKPFPMSGGSLGDLLEEKLKELTSQIEYKSGINGTPTRTPADIFQELIFALNKEQHQQNPQNDIFCLQTNSEKAGYKNTNHLSPGSVLETSFSNDSCCSSSLEDTSGRMQFQNSQKFQNSELVDTIAEIMWTKFGNFFGCENPKTRYQLKRFVFDCLINYLDTHVGLMGSKALIDEVVEEVMTWMDFIGLTADEVAERDMSYSLVNLMDFESELNESVGKIEGDLVKMLVDEIVYDLAMI